MMTQTFNKRIPRGLSLYSMGKDILEGNMGVQVSWTKATEDGESPQGCLSFLGVPIRLLQDSS